MSIRPLNTGPYATYNEFEKVFDRAHKALNRESTISDAASMGFDVVHHGEYLPNKPASRQQAQYEPAQQFNPKLRP